MDKFKLGFKVRIKYDSSIYDESCDFGVSGIVFRGDPIKEQFGHHIDSIFIYDGTIKENEEWCVISVYNSFGSDRSFMIRKENLVLADE